ncbi:MAG: hypothetical protein BZ136_08635 [Methanosphaera sp. rholeuAM74]|nr:MAG: hypothetical protein BZ136_08635 [Methanosphaera sp. rholeuAM74]
MGAAIEVFHMYVVFVTHRSDMRMALHVVKTCALPMIIFSGIGLALSSLVIRYTEGGFHNIFKRRPVEEVPVSQRFQFWLFAVTAIVLSLNFGLNYHLQTNSALQGAKEDLSSAAIDITESYQNIMSRDGHVSFMSNHVGQKGSFFIYNEKTNSAAGIASYGTNKDELIRLTDEHNSGEFFETDVFGSEGLCLETAMYDGSKLLVWLPNTEIYELRDIQSYETLLSDLLLFTVLYILIAMLVQTIVVNNLDLINKSLNKITGGDLDETVSVYESSEFASLSDDINQTVVALKGYIDAAEKRIEQELMLAHTIQDSALPKNFDFNHKGFELYATMNPAKEVGGDFYDFFFTDTDKLALVIADVSGKGIPAALFMMRSKTAIRSLAETGNDPAEVLERVNNELCRGNEADMFVTVWIGIIDLKSGDITCVNAGHEYPVIKRAGGEYELFKDKHGLPLGAMENMKYSEYTMHLDPGDSIYLYTDGVPEAINIQEEQYGTDRMLQALNSCRDMHLKELLPAVKKDIDDFAGEADQFDDTTMLSLNYFG